MFYRIFIRTFAYTSLACAPFKPPLLLPRFDRSAISHPTASSFATHGHAHTKSLAFSPLLQLLLLLLMLLLLRNKKIINTFLVVRGQMIN